MPRHFKIEFYANNLNKKEEERATLEKIGTLLYIDNEFDKNFSNDLSSFILKPQSVWANKFSLQNLYVFENFNFLQRFQWIGW